MTMKSISLWVYCLDNWERYNSWNVWVACLNVHISTNSEVASVKIKPKPIMLPDDVTTKNDNGINANKNHVERVTKYGSFLFSL